mgnify:CR=1 FL=1
MQNITFHSVFCHKQGSPPAGWEITFIVIVVPQDGFADALVVASENLGEEGLSS